MSTIALRSVRSGALAAQLARDRRKAELKKLVDDSNLQRDATVELTKMDAVKRLSVESAKREGVRRVKAKAAGSGGIAEDVITELKEKGACPPGEKMIDGKCEEL